MKNVSMSTIFLEIHHIWIGTNKAHFYLPILLSVERNRSSVHCRLFLSFHFGIGCFTWRNVLVKYRLIDFEQWWGEIQHFTSMQGPDFLAKSLQCPQVHLSLLTSPPISLPLELAFSNEFSHCWKNCLRFAGSSRWDNFSFRTGSVSPKLCRGKAFPAAEHAILAALRLGNPLSAKISSINGNFMTQGMTFPGVKVCPQAIYPPSTPKLPHTFNLLICRVV